MLIYVAFSLHSISCYKNIERIITKRILDCLFTTMMSMKFLAIKLLKASGKLIFQLVILKKPNFQLMMKNQIFSCPEKAGKLQIEIPANSCLTGAEPGASQSVATMALDLMGEIPKTFSRPARTLAFSWVKARLHPLLTPCKSLTW